MRRPDSAGDDHGIRRRRGAVHRAAILGFVPAMIVLLHLPLPGQQLQWRALLPAEPCGADSSLYSVQAADSLHAYACGEDGAAYRSDDGGATFRPMPIDGATDLYEIRFLSASCGYACGDSGVLARTTDGGGTWILARLGGFESKALYAMEWVNDSVGFLAGGSSAIAHGRLDVPGGILLRTTDRGATWSAVLQDATVFFWSLAVIHARTDSTVVFCSQYGPLTSGGVRSSRDGGLTWTTDAQGWPFLPHDLSFAIWKNRLVGIACGGDPTHLDARGSLTETSDGVSWQPAQSLPDLGFAWCVEAGRSGDPHSADSLPPFYIGLQSGAVLVSSDGGETWANSSSSPGAPSGCPVYDLCALRPPDISGSDSEEVLFAAGSGRGLFLGSGIRTAVATPSRLLPPFFLIEDLYPHPVAPGLRNITIRVRLPEPRRCRIDIADVFGRIFGSTECDAGSEEVLSLSLPNLGAGFYELAIRSGALHAERRFVVLR